MNPIILLLVLVLLGFAQGLMSRRALKKLSITRAFDRKTAFVGDRVTMTETIRNPQWMIVPYLRVESRVSRHLQFGTQENLDIANDQYHKSIFFLMPYSQVRRRHHVTLRHRGVFDVGSVALTTGDLWGMGEGTRHIQQSARIYAYPCLLDSAGIDRQFLRWQGDVLVRRWIMPDPFLISGVREYRSGDTLRDVHWPMSARMGALQVKTHDFTADPRLLVILNVQLTESQWGDIMDYETETIERGISLCASLCMEALSAGVEAGFAGNLPFEKETEPVFLPPKRCAGRDEELLLAMARLSVKRTLSFVTFLEELPRVQGLDMIMLSAYDSEAIQEQIRRLRLDGNSVTLHRLALVKKEGAA